MSTLNFAEHSGLREAIGLALAKVARRYAIGEVDSATFILASERMWSATVAEERDLLRVAMHGQIDRLGGSPR
jgi:hypothetical protein